MRKLELSIFREQSVEGGRPKAATGRTPLIVSVGCVKTDVDHTQKGSGRRVQDGVLFVLCKLAELQHSGKALLWCH
ncbi:hypothetical protein ACVWYQ_003307 [Bradyrhizobium sp. USDA 3397]